MNHIMVTPLSITQCNTWSYGNTWTPPPYYIYRPWLNDRKYLIITSGKINSNFSQPTDGQTASPSPPANPDSDIISVASIGGIEGTSYYVESAKNSPTSPSNTPGLVGHIGKLETTKEVSEGELDTIARPTVLLSHTDELEIPELADAETDPPENHQDNGATPLVNTHPPPATLPPIRHIVRLSQASAMPTRWGRIRRSSSARGIPPGRPPFGRQLHDIWGLTGLCAPKSRRPLGWINRGIN